MKWRHPNDRTITTILLVLICAWAIGRALWTGDPYQVGWQVFLALAVILVYPFTRPR